MKRLILSGLILLVASGVLGQTGETWYYKYIETVDASTDVRSKDKTENIYLTFTRNSCYESDEKGIAIKGIYDNKSKIYNYQGIQNDLYVFMYHDYFDAAAEANALVKSFGLPTMPPQITTNTKYYLYFSKDYKRINKKTYYGKTDGGWYMESRKNEDWSDIVYVFEKTDPPKKEKAPNFLY